MYERTHQYCTSSKHTSESFLLRFYIRYTSVFVVSRHSPLHHYCYWNKWVANPIKRFGYIGKGRVAMRLLKTEILEKILLRRTKVQCADVLALPPRYGTHLAIIPYILSSKPKSHLVVQVRSNGHISYVGCQGSKSSLSVQRILDLKVGVSVPRHLFDTSSESGFGALHTVPRWLRITQVAPHIVEYAVFA